MLLLRSSRLTNFGMLLAKPELRFPEGPWKILLEKAYGFFDAIVADVFSPPLWSLRGGTVLMFHFAHRRSKDIDIFVPDSHFLGYINPRTGGRGGDITSDYKDSAEYVKLFCPKGKLTLLLHPPRLKIPMKCMRCLAEIFCWKRLLKLWQRRYGTAATEQPHVICSITMVTEHHHGDILDHCDVFVKNIEVFANQCDTRKSIMMPAFDAIEK